MTDALSECGSLPSSPSFVRRARRPAVVLQGLEAQREELQQRAQTNVLEEVYEEAPQAASSTAAAGSSSTTRSLRWSRSTAGSSTTSTRSSATRCSCDSPSPSVARATTRSRHRRPIRRPFLRSVQAGTVAVDVNPELLVFLGERQDQFPGVKVVQRTVRSYPRHDGRASARLCRPNHPNRVASPQPVDRSRQPRRGQDVPAQPRDRRPASNSSSRMNCAACPAPASSRSTPAARLCANTTTCRRSRETMSGCRSISIYKRSPNRNSRPASLPPDRAPRRRGLRQRRSSRQRCRHRPPKR